MKNTRNIVFLSMLFLSGLYSFESVAAEAGVIKPSASNSCPAVLNHKFTTLQGEKLNLCQFTGRVILFVNTASYCGNTHQYEGLETLYRELEPRGLTVVGFPANDFGGQEPGSDGEIAKFCKLTYGVKFPMMAKSHVVGPNTNPLFAQLSKTTESQPEWNFHKYLVGRDGKTILSFPAQLVPEDPQLKDAIEAMLNKAL
jgi:glutathione peroxidase